MTSLSFVNNFRSPERLASPLYTQKLASFMKVWGVASEDVGSRADFCSCKICIHTIPGV